MDITAEAIRAIVKDVVPPNTSPIDDDSKPLTEFGIDSLDISSVFLELEDQFDVKIPLEDIDDLETVNQIVDYLKKL